MAKITVVNHVTLDGVMQAPAAPDEDTRGGFTRGGWAIPYNDEVMAKHIAAGMAKGGALLFGRLTYDNMAAFWPKQTSNPFTDVLDRTTKYVASTTLRDPLPWEHSVLLDGDAADAVTKLKRELADDLTILGSGVLVRCLMERDLVDEFVLTIHPLVLGSGRRLFDDGVQATLRLVDSIPTTTGVLIATYQPSPPKSGLEAR